MLKKLLFHPILFGISAAFSYALGSTSRTIGDIPLLWLMVALAYIVQIIGFIPALISNSEKYYDIFGNIAYLSIIGFTIGSNSQPDKHQYIAALMILVWTVRLGVYLYARQVKNPVKKADNIFIQIKKSTFRFLNAWLLQGLWVAICVSPLLVVLCNESKPKDLTLVQMSGIVIWIIGLVFETVSDNQKSSFLEQAENKGKFINQGLWTISRHPNYFGQVLVWAGATVFALPSLQGAQYVALISPVFTYFLLLKLSGVSIQEKKADNRWGTEPAYIAYKAKTPVIFPFGTGDKVIITKKRMIQRYKNYKSNKSINYQTQVQGQRFS